MSKVTIEHMGRWACVYVPTWTQAHLRYRTESQRLQHMLRERARTLGWQEAAVIDDNCRRPLQGMAAGFDHLLASVCRGDVGAVLVAEASCLARTSRRWNILLEFCALVDTLIVDGAAIYNPRTPEDRLLLGMKGLLTELDVSPLRQCAQTALREAAPRGGQPGMVPIGYLSRPHEGLLEEDSDGRVREMVELYFRRFCA